jgi:NTP pyrophosphatase (non-canonical NTP hydrolase)
MSQSNLHLPENLTLQELQAYVREMHVERGFSNTTLENVLMLTEEVGELAKAVRKHEKMRTDENSRIGSVKEELADVVLVLTSIANDLGVDLEEAIREKEEVNKKRDWK